jgi:hypothetical protein
MDIERSFRDLIAVLLGIFLDDLSKITKNKSTRVFDVRAKLNLAQV